MRGMFGLVSILVCGFIVAYLWATHTQGVARVNRSVQPQVQQLAGKSADGTPAIKSATFAAVERNGALKALRVTTIDPAGGLSAYWGLQPNDEILRIGQFSMGDVAMDDFESARNWVVEGMQRKMDMTVNRSGTTITLPADRNAPVAPAMPSGAAPQTPTGSSPVKAGDDIANQPGIR